MGFKEGRGRFDPPKSGVEKNFSMGWVAAMGPSFKNETRESRFVFIGRNLDKPELSAGIEACKVGELRFKIGDRVSREEWPCLYSMSPNPINS
jgi:hypothetical protein